MFIKHFQIYTLYLLLYFFITLSLMSTSAREKVLLCIVLTNSFNFFIIPLSQCYPTCGALPLMDRKSVFRAYCVHLFNNRCVRIIYKIIRIYTNLIYLITWNEYLWNYTHLNLSIKACHIKERMERGTNMLENTAFWFHSSFVFVT